MCCASAIPCSSVLDQVPGQTFGLSSGLPVHWPLCPVIITTMANQYTAAPRSVDVSCANCGAPFRTAISRLQTGRGKFCSRACQAAGKAKPATRARVPVAERFFAKVRKTETCWLWEGDVGENKNGTLYGRFWIDGKNRPAHRVSLLLTYGSWPELPVDHKCRVPLCVNPAHLEPVTTQVNLLRGETLAAANARKTHCAKGHPFTGRNIMWRPDGSRRCRTCEQVWNSAAHRARKRLVP